MNSDPDHRAIANDIRSLIGRVTGRRVGVMFGAETPDLLRAEDIVGLALASRDNALPAGDFLAAWRTIERALLSPQEVRVIRSEEPRLRAFAAMEIGAGAATLAEDTVAGVAFQRYARLKADGEDVGGISISTRRMFDRLAAILRATGKMLKRRGVVSVAGHLRSIASASGDAAEEQDEA